MFRIFTLALTILAAGGGSDAKPTPPVAAKTVTLKSSGTLAELSAELTKQTGLAFDLSGVDDKTTVNANFSTAPAWTAVEALADQANCFVSVAGNKVKWTKRPTGVGKVPSGVDGPFRVVLKKVVARKDPELADTDCEVHLEVQWEPRFPVYLIDTEPKATATTDKLKLTPDAASVRVIPTGFTHAAVVRLKNVPRQAKQLEELTCSFRVVAAEKLLAVEFKDLTGDKPVSQTTDGVTVTLDPVKRFDKRAEFRVGCEYPAGQPEFESFQLWHASNTFRLYPPNDPAGRTTTDVELSEGGRRPWTQHSFAQLPELKGWRAVYETPGPMSEQTVTVTLRGIPLP